MTQPDEQTQLSMRVPVELKRRLALFCCENDLKMKYVVVDAVNEYLERHKDDKEHE